MQQALRHGPGSTAATRPGSSQQPRMETVSCRALRRRSCLPFSAPGRCRAAQRIARARSSEAALQQTEPVATDKSVPKSEVWELDFCSRPLLDERGKKVWELLICDPERKFEFSQYFPNSKINSGELRKAIEELLAQPGAVRPEKVRFFRGQMQNIISKAVSDLGAKPVPSRRCFSVMGWLEQRAREVYPADARYNEKAQSLFMLDLGAPEPLPDALRGEKWAFVQLPLGPLQDMLQRVEAGDMFGASLALASVGCADFPRDRLIPGVAVFSRRALPLAAWTNGLEIAAVKADVERSSLVLETGVQQRWRYGGWRPSPDSIEEAQGWEEAKVEARGLHFLAVQPDPDSEELNGLWLLQDRMPPQI